MDCAASIAGIIGLAGQTAAVAAQLHSFFQSIANAPSEVQAMARELLNLHNVLSYITDVAIRLDGSAKAPRALWTALLNCKAELSAMEASVHKLKLRAGDGAHARLWRRIKWAFGKEDLERALHRLGALKETVQLALSGLSLYVANPTNTPVRNCRLTGVGRIKVRRRRVSRRREFTRDGYGQAWLWTV